MKKKFVSVLTCLCLFNSFVIASETNSYATIHVQAMKSSNNSNLVNDPINITNNFQLANQASSGDGSQENPYIIENYYISNFALNTAGVSIQNTSKYFVLNNITVSYCTTGFFFNNVTFGSIINSYATKNYIGFEIASSSNNKLINDTAAGNFWYGFELSWSSAHNTLSNNTASKNTSYTSGVITPPKNVYIGFRLYQSSYNDLISNKAAGNGEGFELDHSYHNNLASNIATGNSQNGFALSSSSSNLLTNNIATNNGNGFTLNVATDTDNGFTLAYSSSSFNLLTDNTATKNVDGFTLYYASGNRLSGNTASNNGDTGFYLDSSTSNVLTSNSAFTNKKNGFYLSSCVYNILKNNIGENNLGYDYYAINSPSSNAISLSNRFITSYSLSTTPVDPISFVGAICIIIFIIAILLGLLAVFPSPPDRNRSSPIVLVEKILTESYQVPDYETTEKIRQGGFPDYPTFKQALDKGITSYTEWLNYQKNQ